MLLKNNNIALEGTTCGFTIDYTLLYRLLNNIVVKKMSKILLDIFLDSDFVLGLTSFDLMIDDNRSELLHR